jgi:hypothetical protein
MNLPVRRACMKSESKKVKEKSFFFRDKFVTKVSADMS